MTIGLQDQRSATEPWTYRTAADCSTTELYPLTHFLLIQTESKYSSLCITGVQIPFVTV